MYCAPEQSELAQALLIMLREAASVDECQRNERGVELVPLPCVLIDVVELIRELREGDGLEGG